MSDELAVEAASPATEAAQTAQAPPAPAAKRAVKKTAAKAAPAPKPKAAPKTEPTAPKGAHRVAGPKGRPQGTPNSVPKVAKPALAKLPSKPDRNAPDFIRFRRAADGLKMVADATRIAIVTFLSAEPLNVQTMCARLGQSQPGVSHHLALLRAANVVECRRDGKFIEYTLTDKGRQLVKVTADYPPAA